MHKRAVRSGIMSGLVFATAIALTACSAGGADTTSTATAAAGAVNLAGVCPSTVVIQTDWYPQAEHGHLYQLLGPNPVINTDQKSVTGDLDYKGEPTGVKVQIRSGGPAIGSQAVSSVMYQDKSITLGYMATDGAVMLSGKSPVTGVFTPMDISPYMIMWDPAIYPHVKDIKQLGVALQKNGGVVRYFAGSSFLSYLTGSGLLPESVAASSYDGTPAAFVAAKGKDAQQGFASAEPYIYQHELPAWNKPVKYELLNDVGYPNYPSAVSVRSGELTKLSPCLTKLVPVLQQAEVDYFKSPAAINKLIVELVEDYNVGYTYSLDLANYAVATMKKLKLVGNGNNAYMGDMDKARVQKMISIITPIAAESNTPLKAGLKPSDLFTNKFIDTSIGF